MADSKGNGESKQTKGNGNSNDFVNKDEILSIPLEENDAPGKPQFDGYTETGVRLSWTRSNSNIDEVENYQIFFRKKGDRKWSKKKTEDDQNKIILENLEDNTLYTFKVRACYNDTESAFSQESQEIQTKESDVNSLLAAATMKKDGTPPIFKVAVVESWKDDEAKFKGCVVGKQTKQMSCVYKEQKTILIVGATGAGKSTLLDGMVNYLFGVRWQDNVRFSVLDLTVEEADRQNNQTLSQTEWITCYKLCPRESLDMQFELNIIDTPGFGDTRGVERDREIAKQIEKFFISDKGTDHLNAVCFVTQSSNVRLTPTQSYISDSILAMFGKDMAEHIIVMATFADGRAPPVIKALSEAEVPFTEYFPFNNSALFVNNVERGEFTKICWDLGQESYKNFFNRIKSMPAKSLKLTKEVLGERERLELNISHLLPAIDKRLNKMEEIRQHEKLFRDHEHDIEKGKKFTAKRKIPDWKEEKLEPGVYVTHCFHCNHTCHYPCCIPDDEDKAHCSAMVGGKCQNCPSNCSWNNHRNHGFRVIAFETEIEITVTDLLELYNKGVEGKKKVEIALANMQKETREIEVYTSSLIEVVAQSLNRLKEIALKQDPLTNTQYIDLLIKSEKQQTKPGFQGRIDSLEKLKKIAELKKKAVSEASKANNS